MQDRALYSIKEGQELLGGISRNGIYALLRTGELASVVIGCRRFISGAEIAALMHLFAQYLFTERRRCVKESIRISVIGRRDRARTFAKRRRNQPPALTARAPLL